MGLWFVVLFSESLFHVLFACKFARRRLNTISLFTVALFVISVIGQTFWGSSGVGRLYQMISFLMTNLVIVYSIFKDHKRAITSYSITFIILTLIQPALFLIAPQISLIILKIVTVAIAVLLCSIKGINSIFDFIIKSNITVVIVNVLGVVAILLAIFANLAPTTTLLLIATLLTLTVVVVVGYKHHKRYKVFHNSLEKLQKYLRDADEDKLKKLDKFIEEND